MRSPRRQLALLAALLAGCATPAARVESRAAELRLEALTLAGAPFLHRAFFRPGAGELLRVYLDNDGLPWLRDTLPSPDPSPRRALMLEALAADPGPALYLGRPCHFTMAQDPACAPLAWTHRRYAAEAVASLETALRAFLARHPHRRIALIGHSGGGTLALLLAERIEATVAVVTLAGNLDLAGWTRLHGYSPLAGSLDPMERPPLRASVLQWHLAGAADRQFPPALTLGYAARNPQVSVEVLPGVDHLCCWAEAWPALLERLHAALR